jgi:hypothetical protein
MGKIRMFGRMNKDKHTKQIELDPERFVRSSFVRSSFDRSFFLRRVGLFLRFVRSSFGRSFVHQRNAEFELFHFLRTFQQCIFIKRTDEQTANERTEKGTIFSLRSLVTLSHENL